MRACQGGCRKKRGTCEVRCRKEGLVEASIEDASSRIFREFDGDNDGSITKEEFSATVAREDLDLDANQEFMSFDKDQDGVISLDEACARAPGSTPSE